MQSVAQRKGGAAGRPLAGAEEEMTEAMEALAADDGVRHEPVRVEKPWGYELIWAHAERYVGKVLHVRAGHALSLQYHRRKDETIHLASGSMRFEYDRGSGRREVILEPGDSMRIRPGVVHRMTALTDCDVLEVSTPELEDVVRLEDRYGR
jgi:mannose-6-phosphate isomerase-like protein (cupin superfamily)